MAFLTHNIFCIFIVIVPNKGTFTLSIVVEGSLGFLVHGVTGLALVFTLACQAMVGAGLAFIGTIIKIMSSCASAHICLWINYL